MQRFQNMSVRVKLAAGFGVVLLLTVTLGLVMLSELGRVRRGGTYLGRRALPQTEAINMVARDAIDLRRAQLKYVLDPATAAGAQARTDWQGDQHGVAVTMRTLWDAASSAADRRLWHAVDAAWANLLARTAPLVSLAPHHEASANALVTASLPAYKALMSSIDAWTGNTASEARATLRANAADYSSAQAVGYALLALVIVISSIVAYVISASIKRRVDVVLARLRSIERHCLTFLLKPSRRRPASAPTWSRASRSLAEVLGHPRSELTLGSFNLNE